MESPFNKRVVEPKCNSYARYSICDCRNCGPICRFEVPQPSDVVKQFIEAELTARDETQIALKFS